jgi:3-(3-hydroxy-phenyl)propionate hydroxylase
MAADYAYRPSADQRAGRAVHHPVIVVGAGPVGLSLALDLAARGVPPVVLEARTAPTVGSRAVCYAKRSLEILDRLGVGQRMLDTGVVWQKGKVFWRERMVYQFDLLPEAGHRMPAFVNCQQYTLEDFLVERAAEVGLAPRFGHRVAAVAPAGDGVRVTVETQDGAYALTCDWLLACDGARSTVRRALGLAFEGQVFKDQFLITDVRMEADYPPERWFWFDPPFHPGQSALLHSQPGKVWRIDLQLGRDADPEAEVRPERVIPRLAAMLGKERRFELLWTSIYTFRCRRLPRFRHGRIIFLGDAAHEVSPFGARGFNSGIQDADNLAWKLAWVLQGRAPERLLDSYDAERLVAADENIRHSTRSTEFITPRNAASRAYRDAVLALAEHHPFARRMLNSGRLSTPTRLDFSALNTADDEPFAAGLPPGAPCEDAPLQAGERGCWLLNQLDGAMTLLRFVARPQDLDAAPPLAGVEVKVVVTAQHPVPPSLHGLPAFADRDGLAATRYGAAPGTCYLIRPDQHVAARWRRFDEQRVRAAVQRTLAAEVAAPALAEAPA